MYKTLEELQNRYPINSVYHTSFKHIQEWCPTEKDIAVFKQKHPNILNFKRAEDGTVEGLETIEDKVEGYIFDGEYWYPAYRNWDGWQTITEEECKKNYARAQYMLRRMNNLPRKRQY